MMDQGSIAVGPLFIDKNFLGKHLDSARARRRRSSRASRSTSSRPGGTRHRRSAAIRSGIAGRRRAALRGHATATISLSQPLWSLASEWGGGASFSASQRDRAPVLRHRPARVRRSRHAERRRRCRASTGCKTLVGQRERDAPVGHDAQAAARRSATRCRASGRRCCRHVPGAIRCCARGFIATCSRAPRSSRQPFVEYSFFQPRYRTLRNVDTYELAEDVRLGPISTSSFAQGLKLLGSDVQLHAAVARRSAGRSRGAATASCGRRPAIVAARSSDGARRSTTPRPRRSRAATPTFGYVPRRRAGRTIDDALARHAERVLHDRLRQRPARLRHQPVHRPAPGRRRRSRRAALPYPFWVLRARRRRCSTRSAAPRTRSHEMQLHHDVGFGVRMLIPQTSRELFRFDLAFPLDARPGDRGQPALHRGLRLVLLSRRRGRNRSDEVDRRSR